MIQKNYPLALWLVISLSSLILTILLVPAILVKKHDLPESAPTPSIYGAADKANEAAAEQPIVVPVYLSKQQRTEQLNLEKYIQGVIAAEMPIEFEPEALKAQAMAARTYVVRRLLEQEKGAVSEKEAPVTDTTSHQAYVTDDELKARWGEQYAPNMDKLNKAVQETAGQILTYRGQPIDATFFSTSNGYTENSEDYWERYIPYLRSVPSPWDLKLSPRYKGTVTIALKDVQRKLGLAGAIPVGSSNAGIKVLERSEGHRIKKITIGGKTFTGREVREKLGLDSSQFEWVWIGGNLQFTTYGYGHGVGMSQWGANGMAKEGRRAEDIVKYYYSGIEISQASSFFSKH